MTHGSNLARQEEYDKFVAAFPNADFYSPVQNKSINDKASMTEEENNHLAEKIVDADVERLWNSDYTVMCPEQHALGTLCEVGILYGWKYMAQKLLPLFGTIDENNGEVYDELKRIAEQKNYFHYSDIRTNHLNEKDWRRSFSINQLLYGIILAAAKDGKLHDNFDEVLELMKKEGVADE